MKALFIPIAILVVAGCAQKSQNSESIQKSYPITPFDIREVTLTDQFWLPKIKLIQQTTIKHSFQKCEDEGRMENFFIAGGVKKGTTKGLMPFDDTDLYKIIEGASYSLVSFPNQELDTYLDSVISIIKTGQEPDGYITTWFTIDRAHPPANWVKPSKERWENEISSHELYNSGHLFEAAAAHYRATGKKNLLDIALKNADLLVANFKPGKLQVPPGHQIVETGLIKLYDITHKKDYLELARFFVDLRGDSTTHKLYGAYNQDHIPVVDQAEAVGHAVRAEYMYAAATDIAAIYHDESYRSAMDKIWDNIVNRKMYITGGVGARHDGEAFGDNYELPNLEAYNETCAAIGSVGWNQRMFMLSGNSKYYDILERTLYNGLISGISTDGKLFFYPNPLESNGKFEFNKGSCTRQSWFDCSCCPTNMIRFLPTLPGLIYASNEDTVYVNLFISSKLNNEKIKLTTETGYPWNGNVKISIDPETKSNFPIKIRIPGWARNEAVPGDLYKYADVNTGSFKLMVNGVPATAELSNGYVTIPELGPGTEIDLSFPMNVRKVITSDHVPENKNKVAFELGPIVYCAEGIDNPALDNIALPADVTLQPKKRQLLTDEVNVLEGENLTLIPYYIWSNRGVGKMKVWLNSL